MGKFKQVKQKEEVLLGEALMRPLPTETIYIHMDDIVANKKNDYSTERIEELAQMIELSGGILQDCIVKPQNENGKYELTTGERRWRAAQLLRKEGRYPRKYNNCIPCKISDPQKVELPLSDDLKEDFSILVTNRYREKTDGDRMMEIQKWKKIIQSLRDEGVDFLQGTAGEEIPIKGVGTRVLTSQFTGMSTGTISKFEEVEKNATDAVKENLSTDKITVTQAQELSKLPEKEQNKIARKIQKEDKSAAEILKKEQKKKDVLVTVTIGDVLNDINEFSMEYGTKEISLSDIEYRQCQKHAEKILQMLMKNRN